MENSYQYLKTKVWYIHVYIYICFFITCPDIPKGNNNLLQDNIFYTSHYMSDLNPY